VVHPGGYAGAAQRRSLTAITCAAFLASAGGCALGPKELHRTHGRYNEAISSVYEEQLLRNIVHARYNETPARLDVSAVAAQYELSAQAEARPFFIAPNPSNSNVIFRTFTSILPDVQAGGFNRPTITFTPADDGATVRRFLTPIPEETLVFLGRTNWPVFAVLRLWVERMNGLPNAVPASGPPLGAVPDFARFQRVAELFQLAAQRELFSLYPEDRLVEVSGPLSKDAITAFAAVEAARNGMEYRPRGDGKTWVLFRKERKLVVEVNAGAEGSPEVAELRELLNLRPGQRRYDFVVRGGTVPDPQKIPREPLGEIRVVPRSTAQVLFYLANGVEVPPEHLQAGLVAVPVDTEGKVFDTREVTRGLFEVHVCKGLKPPAGAYVAVKYRGWWYYIDDADQMSKAILSLMLQLTRLDLAGQRPGGPVLTLPVGR
jgi:hypothetical protein